MYNDHQILNCLIRIKEYELTHKDKTPVKELLKTIPTPEIAHKQVIERFNKGYYTQYGDIMLLMMLEHLIHLLDNR